MRTKILLTSVMLLWAVVGWGQEKIKIYEKRKGEQLIIPFQVPITGISDIIHAKLEFKDGDFTKAPDSKSDISIKLDDTVKGLNNDGKDAKYLNVTFYAIVEKNINPNTETILNFEYSVKKDMSEKSTIKVQLIPAPELVYTVTDYFGNNKLKLRQISKIESTNNTLVLTGYNQSKTTAIRKVELEEGEVFALKDCSALWNSKHWKPLPLSLITVPFKIRPGVTFKNNKISSSATLGTNIGVNLDLIKRQIDRYFISAKKSTHKYGLGFFASPSIEELESANTDNFLNALGTKSKQLFISTGLTISYSYNDISFIVVPRGWDIATSTLGKNWAYGGRRWWGFGIGVSPKIFSTVLNGK